MSNTFLYLSPLPVYCKLPGDIQQLCWQWLLTACRRYMQWHISCLSSITIDVRLLIDEVSKSHSNAPQSVELLWTSGQLVAETSTWQHTTLTTDRHPCPPWDSNPRSQRTSGRGLMPQAARPLGPVSCTWCWNLHFQEKNSSLELFE
jgi:hypothetical protein